MNLVERLKQKEEAAVIEMMDRYGDSLLRTAILLVKDPHLAEEVVQDTFVTAYQKIHQLHDERKLRSWLLMITANGCRGRMRKWSWKNIFLHQEQEQEDHLIDEHELLPEETLIATWRDQQLRDAITLLPYHYREAITLYYFQELTIKEIVAFLKENENTVKTRLARARTLLKIELMKGGVDIAK